MNNVINELGKLRRASKSGAEYWCARDLKEILGYSEWRNFTVSISRAKATCANNGREVKYHFVEVNKTILTGKGAERTINDYLLSRYACYLVAMNGDTSKPEIAEAQEYFAVEARKSELALQIQQAKARIEYREDVKVNNKNLSNAAQAAGVLNFGKFNNAGYEGMYGGLNNSEIKEHKGIPENESLLDRIGRAELAANNFRITQAETKLQVENIEGEDEAIKVHNETGKLVRQVMEKAGKTLPEDLPAEPHIEEVKELVKKHDRHEKLNATSSTAPKQLS